MGNKSPPNEKLARYCVYWGTSVKASSYICKVALLIKGIKDQPESDNVIVLMNLNAFDGFLIE